MSELPSMPYYIDDFEADTAHLSLEEDGAYNRILRLCWRSPECSIPDDDTWIQRRLRVDSDTFLRVVAPLLDEFFTRDKNRIWQKRQRQEYAHVMGLVLRRKEAGSKGGISKALKRKDIDPSKATVLPVAKGKQTPSKPLAPKPKPISEEEETNVSSKKKQDRGSRLSADWQLPTDWANWAAAEGLPNPGKEADRFRDYWISVAGSGGVKLDWQATWRNWVRKAVSELQQRGKVVSFKPAPEDDEPRTGTEKIGPTGKLLRYSGWQHKWFKAEEWREDYL